MMMMMMIYLYFTLPANGLWMKPKHYAITVHQTLVVIGCPYLNLLCVYQNGMSHIKILMSTFSYCELFHQFWFTVALRVLSIYHEIKRNKICWHYKMAGIWAFTLVTTALYNLRWSSSRQLGMDQTALGSEGIINVNICGKKPGMLWH